MCYYWKNCCLNCTGVMPSYFLKNLTKWDESLNDSRSAISAMVFSVCRMYRLASKSRWLLMWFAAFVFPCLRQMAFKFWGVMFNNAAYWYTLWCVCMCCCINLLNCSNGKLIDWACRSWFCVVINKVANNDCNNPCMMSWEKWFGSLYTLYSSSNKAIGSVFLLICWCAYEKLIAYTISIHFFHVEHQIHHC